LLNQNAANTPEALARRQKIERRAHHRLFEIHNLRLKDGKSYVDFMDRLIATAGHDWETNIVDTLVL